MLIELTYTTLLYTPRDLIFRMENQIGVCEPEANTENETASSIYTNQISRNNSFYNLF